MKKAEIEQEIIDMVSMAYQLDVPPTGVSTLAELELDSLDAVEVQLMLEDRWGSELLDDYLLGADVRIAEIAAEIERRLA